MLNRRELLKRTGAIALTPLLPGAARASINQPKGNFRFCLNTSTISGQKPGLTGMIDIAAKAGYDGLELWINDIREYLKKGNSIRQLRGFISERKLKVEGLISFTSWMVDDDEKRKAGVADLEEEMKLMAELGCGRIAAPPAGVSKDKPLDFQKAGERYRHILGLGRKYNVTPHLEFWGASGTLFNLGQALAIAAAANDPDARILPDVYHLFRGGSGFEGLKLVNGRAIEIIHINDYPGNKPVAEQNDSDRVYPGDGAAPIKQVLTDLKTMGGTKVLSLELFNRSYWEQDALEVAKTGLRKVKSLVDQVA